MLEKLLALLMQSKAGVITGIFIVGATGALVTTTTQNGTTTVTVTEPSPTPTAAATPTTKPTESPNLLSPTLVVTSHDPTTATGVEPCKVQAHEREEATRKVDRAFKQFHTGLERLREDNKDKAAREKLERADRQLKTIRKAAVKAIHATKVECKKDDDEDEDEDADEDHDKDHGNDKAKSNVKSNGHDEDENKDKDQPAITFTAKDPAGIAKEAVAMMELVFNDAKAGLTTTVADPTKKPEKKEDKKHDDKKSGETRKPEPTKTPKPQETPKP